MLSGSDDPGANHDANATIVCYVEDLISLDSEEALP
jgi:hypothetical protein